CKLKGKFLAQKNINDFSLLETILFHKNFEHLDLHLKRMRESAEYFSYKYDENNIMVALNKLLPKLSGRKYKIRVLVDKSGEVIVGETNIINTWDNIKLKLSSTRTDSNNIFLFHKTTNREMYNKELESAREHGFFDVIFFNTHGHITEGAITNIYLQKNGQLYTPPVESGLLNGTIRQTLISKKEVKEKELTLEDLKNADEIYVSNSIIGLRKINSIDI
ncbi:aminotransferase class IV, partial [Spirochaetota bacterium]